AFGVGAAPERLAAVAPGVFWVLALLAALLSLDRVFQADFEDGSLDLLALGEAPLEAVALAKAAAHWTVTGLPLSLAAPALGPMLSLDAGAAPILGLSLLLGTPALSLAGGVGAALTVGVRRGGLLLSVLALPLFVPTLIFGAIAARAAAEGTDPSAALALCGAVSLAALALAPFAAAAALRAAMR
ncbi:MAG: heme exporter protein CcmB, partial [Pseudomonadota bacterium]